MVSPNQKIITDKRTPTLPENWHQKNDGFTQDHLLDAYLLGLEKGKSEYSQIILKEFKSNFEKAITISEDLFKYGVDNNFELQFMRLKVDAISSFSIIIFSTEEKFISDEFRNMYDKSIELKNKFNDNSFHISISSHTLLIL